MHDSAFVSLLIQFSFHHFLVQFSACTKLEGIVVILHFVFLSGLQNDSVIFICFYPSPTQTFVYLEALSFPRQIYRVFKAWWNSFNITSFFYCGCRMTPWSLYIYFTVPRHRHLYIQRFYLFLVIFSTSTKLGGIVLLLHQLCFLSDCTVTPWPYIYILPYPDSVLCIAGGFVIYSSNLAPVQSSEDSFNSAPHCFFVVLE